ncbi:site-specific integrase [Streptosporangium vulgare]|uniref:Tyr recombinase domain-containing protein n=1 Tax=Streptosporangium vulgare TaxID=46190 RepID=A0ABV5TFH3_9ACTN
MTGPQAACAAGVRGAGPCGGAPRRRLDRLTVAEVQTFLNGKINGEEHSIGTVHVMRNVLSAALTRAMREEIISRNVARLATLPMIDSQRNQPWTADEARAFLRVARFDPLYPAFVLLLLYGLRRGEALGLRWVDVDFDEGHVNIRRQLVRVGKDAPWAGEDQGRKPLTASPRCRP